MSCAEVYARTHVRSRHALRYRQVQVDFSITASKMSTLWSWLKKSNPSLGGEYPKPKSPFLPDPNLEKTSADRVTCASANAEIEGSTKSPACSSPAETRNRRGSYGFYSEILRAKIAKYANEHGLSAASRHFSKELDRRVPITTVETFRNTYRKEIAVCKRDPADVTILPKKRSGRPFLVPSEIDFRVRRHLTALRDAGGVVNRRITICTGVGVLRALKPSLLPENGGSLVLGRPGAESILRRMDFVKRKGTKAAKKLPENFLQVKADFLERVAAVIEEYSIPPQLVFNLNETGLPIIPVSEWMLSCKGQAQVPVIGLEDKRQITAVLTCSVTGKLLPPQLLYQGKTTRCHPAKVAFPPEWDIWHSESHWSTHETIKRLVGTVLVPYTEKIKEQLGLPATQKSLLILDVFRAHRTDDVLDELRSSGFILQYVPANCTSELQPLDLSVNSMYKGTLKDRFTYWYAQKVADAMNLHNNIQAVVNAVQPDLKLSVVKPLHAGWTMDTHNTIALQESTILAGWEKSGLLQAVQRGNTGGNEHDEPTIKPHSKEVDCDGEAVKSSTKTACAASVSISTARTCQEMLYRENYLPPHLCQSKVDGRHGSNACTVIATCVAKSLLDGSLRFPKPDVDLDQDVVDGFVKCMRDGNELYDSNPYCHGYLSCYQVTRLWPEMMSLMKTAS